MTSEEFIARINEIKKKAEFDELFSGKLGGMREMLEQIFEIINESETFPTKDAVYFNIIKLNKELQKYKEELGK